MLDTAWDYPGKLRNRLKSYRVGVWVKSIAAVRPALAEGRATAGFDAIGPNGWAGLTP